MSLLCPGCHAPLASPTETCRTCGLDLGLPGADALWRIEYALADLVRQRNGLLTTLHARTHAAAPGAHASGGYAPGGYAPGGMAQGGTRPEVPRVGVRNVLLGLGAVTLGIAAVVFTALTWDALGLFGRAAILCSLTGIALGLVWPLARRGLAATAEAVAFVGLVLLGVLAATAYGSDVGGLGHLPVDRYGIGASAVIALLWTAYARVAPLRATAPTAVVLAQIPALFVILALDGSFVGTVTTLLVLSLADLGIRTATRSIARGVATAAGASAGTLGTAGALAGLLVALGTPWTDAAGEHAAVIALAGLVAAAWAVLVDRRAALATGAALTSLLTAVAINPPGAPARLNPPIAWTPVALLLAAIAVACAALISHRFRNTHAATDGTTPPSPRASADAFGGAGGRGLFGGLPAGVRWLMVGALAMGATGLPFALYLVLDAAVRPLRVLDGGVWQGGDLFATSLTAGPVTFVILAVVGARFPAVAVPAVVLAAVGLPGTELGPFVAVAVAAGLAAWAVRRDEARVAAGIGAVVLGAWTVTASLAGETRTVGVLAALTAAAAVVALVSAPLRPAAQAVAVLTAGGCAAAQGLAAGLPAHGAAFAVLAAAAVGTALGRVPAEIAAAATGAAALAMTADDPAWLSCALATAGVIATAAALRPSRRDAAYAGSALLALAWWVRLGASGVTVPEAYTAPVSLALLVVGHLRRPKLSSWAAYGPALAGTLVPSLLAAWSGDGAVRPALLALGATAIVLAGARLRLQAPLALGGAILLLDALRYLAPLLQDLPGWIPITVVGLLLVAVGATYERRLRDLRRARAAFARLG
ncbi:DUF2157 domain-containing protein [Actinomadura rayongensis]|uniref:DUF2157 domain-containing protein n=1 Tax=Actinomadura rayongensis TaxID=1429076 RepID=A0A6I4W6F6_9ACTN|nr:DUF2157 domain-containing protein [Actinomadura rayongensis]MXQ65148.1 hypothetical protein [Actinomadura rayongensis]